MAKEKKAMFVPKAQEVAPIDEKYSQEDVEKAQAFVEQEEKDKGMSVVQKLNVVWTIVSTLYAIASTCMFVAKKWVDSIYTYILIPMLAVLVITFVVLVVLTFKDKKKLKTNVKNYKKVLGIFKAFVNVFFLAISAVSMAGIATGETSLVKWIVFGVTFFVALMQLVLKIIFLQNRRFIKAKPTDKVGFVCFCRYFKLLLSQSQSAYFIAKNLSISSHGLSKYTPLSAADFSL